MPRKADWSKFIGREYGSLVVKGVEKRGRRMLFSCLCACGKTCLADDSNVRAGRQKSCGCGRHVSRPAPNKTHGASYTLLYSVWTSMRQRCLSSGHRAFPNYGGRGIEVCEEWRESFEAFRDWSIAGGYAIGLTLDRIDNDGPYSPPNCRWSTRAEQNRNQRRTVYLTVNGETKTRAEWAEDVGVLPATIHQRLKRGWTPEAALSTEKWVRNEHANRHQVE